MVIDWHGNLIPITGRIVVPENALHPHPDAMGRTWCVKVEAIHLGWKTLDTVYGKPAMLGQMEARHLIHWMATHEDRVVMLADWPGLPDE